MKITGFQKTSLIDYPGYIVSVIFTQGCNFKCPYCHNSDLIYPESKNNDYFPMEYIFSFIKNRKGLIDGVSITGGEPTLQTDLTDFIKKVRKMDLRVKIDTNGSNPDLISKLINDKLIDYIAMDIKGIFPDYNNITAVNVSLDNIEKSISTIINDSIDYEFRTTVVPGLHDNKKMKEIAQIIKGSNKFFIQNFKPQNTFNQEYMKKTGFPPASLEEFKEICKPYINLVEIRN